ncbi:MAG TPA: tyrosinase family protein [Nitrososphaeraceae archaeon]|nr:tyrosinase family protein [Nitrososphaeraceae archaeon]
MGHRRDLNSLSAADRTALVNLMLNYINDDIVWQHNPLNPNAIVHHEGEHAFITHRNFIGDLESWLASHGGSKFVPLPMWDPGNSIPSEFNVVKPQDNSTPRPPLQNLNPNIPKPANLNSPALCTLTTNGDILWNNHVDGWHGAVHVTIGGTMGDITIAPAAPIFFCWHGFVDEIYEDYLTCRWSGWEDLGGIITSAPSVASWAANRLDCFVRGQDSHMWHKWWNGSSWSGWEDLGGKITAAPAVASRGTNRLDCFVKGQDNALWYKWIDSSVVHGHPGVWSGWHSLGGILDNAPAAVSWGPNRIDCFVRGMNNHMWHKWRA